MNADSKAPSDDRLEQIIADFLEAERTGQDCDRERLIARNPDSAERLREFFRDRDSMQSARPSIESHAQSSTSFEPTRILDFSEVIRSGDESTAQTRISGSPENTSAQHHGTFVRYFGDYELLREIARGGMGVVYEARQTKLNRTVALKMILAGQLASLEDVRRFRTEAEAAAQLDHPRIVPIFEVGEHDGQHYFSMGFVDGRPLSAQLAEGPLPAREAAELLRAISLAVQYAHAHGVIHRDLKPANILVAKGGEPRITDFGLAKRVDTEGLTATGQVLGTPSYMPPEQAGGRVDEVRETADVYSLGAILYAALTGRPPFQAESQLDTILQVLARDPVAPRELVPSVPKDLETICLKCLEKDRGRRYQSAQDLADELLRFLNGQPIVARPIGATARLWRWCRRNPVVATLTASSALLLLAATTISAVAYWKTSDALAKESASKLEAVAQRDAALRNLYLAQFRLAWQSWEAADTVRTEQLLDELRPSAETLDLRGWEWHYLNQLLHSEIYRIPDAAGEIRSVACSPDGSRLISVEGDWGKNCRVRIRDSTTGKQLLELAGTRVLTGKPVWHPNGKQIAFTSRTTDVPSDPVKIEVWDADSATSHFDYPGVEGQVGAIAWSPDGIYFAASCNVDAANGSELINVTEFSTRQIVASLITPGPVVSLAWHPSGKFVAAGLNTEQVVIWEMPSGREFKTIASGKMRRHGELSSVRIVAWSPSGKYLAAVGRDPEIHLWNGETWEESPALTGHAKVVWDIAWHKDGEKLASSGGDGTVRIWNADTGRELMRLRGARGPIAWRSDGRVLIAGDRAWDAQIGQEPRTLSGKAGETFVAWSPDGTRLASSHAVNFRDEPPSEIRIWDANSRKLQRAIPVDIAVATSLAWNPRQPQLAIAVANDVEIWDVNAGNRVRSLKGHLAPVNCSAWHPEGKLLATSAQVSPNETDSTITLWDVENAKSINRHEDRFGFVRSLAWSPDGNRLAAACSDRTVRILDNVEVGRCETLKGHQDMVLSVAWSLDGKNLASACDDGTIIIWDSRSLELIHRLAGHQLEVSAVAWNIDGRIASGGHDGTVRIWDAAIGKELMTLRGYHDTVTAVAWSPDGQKLVSAGDGIIKVWDAIKVSRRVD